MVANFDTSMLLFFALTTAHLLRGWGDDHVPSSPREARRLKEASEMAGRMKDPGSAPGLRSFSPVPNHKVMKL